MSDTKNTFGCGEMVVINGQRYILTELVSYPIDQGISVRLTATAYEYYDPVVNAFISKKSKPKKRTKSKRKIKSK